jgi:hypothetical protein
VRFDCTIPAGSPTCHFTIWRGGEAEAAAWEAYTKRLEEKALERARKDEGR